MSILIVTGIEGARNCAAVVQAQLGMEVEVAEGRKAALAALRRREFLAVAVDETMAECDPAAAEAPCRSTSPSPALRGSSARFAPRCTAASGSRLWPAAPPLQPSKPSSNPLSRACCFTRSWLSAAPRSPRRLPKGCAWWQISPAISASS